MEIYRNEVSPQLKRHCQDKEGAEAHK